MVYGLESSQTPGWVSESKEENENKNANSVQGKGKTRIWGS